MPVRHFYLLPHYSCNGLFFLFSVCWLHVNEFNSLWEELRGRSQKTTATQKVCLFGIFTCSHITVAMVYSFYFLLVGSRRNERNSLFGEKKGARSEDCGLFWYCLRYAVNDDKMISPAITVHDKFIIIYKGDYFIFLENDNALSFFVCFL